MHSDYQNLGKALNEIKSDFVAACPRYDWMSESIVLYGDPTAVLPVYQYKSGNITENTQWCGSIVVEDDISVAAGVTLTIQPGTGIFFKSGKFLEVNGTLIAKGTASYPIVFSSASESPSQGDWDGIRFENSSVDADCIIKHCEIEYADYGIYCYYANPTIENNTISNCTYGIYLYYSSPANVETNHITGNSRGIYGVHSSPTITDNLITDNSYLGLYFSNYCAPKLYNNTFHSNPVYSVAFYNYVDAELGPIYGSGKGYNVIRDNARGIKAQIYSDPFLGSSDAYNSRIGGYNELYSNTYYNLQAYYYCDIEAQWCWWGAIPPPGIEILSFSTVNINNFLLWNPPGGGSSLAKSTADLVQTTGNVNLTYQQAGFNPKKPNPDRLSDLWLWGHDLRINGKVEDAIEVYQKLVGKFSDDHLARKALGKMYILYQQSEREGFDLYLNQLLDNPSISEDIYPTIYSMLMSCSIAKHDIENSVKTGEMILELYPDTEEEKIALFDLVQIGINEDNRKDAALKYLDIMKKKYPDDELTFFAREALGEEVNWALFKPINEPEDEAIPLPDKYALHSNYPNPFNPLMTIEYDLPEEAQVTLVIYDLSGREVTRLVHSRKPAGFYRAVWDGKNSRGQLVSSGVYLYRIHAGKFSRTNKMIFMR